MKILFLGDVVGRPGRGAVRDDLPGLTLKHEPDLIVVNAENASGGLGLTPKSARDLFSLGVDVLTSGNHIWKHREIYGYMTMERRLIRPANYPEGAPGRGMEVFETASGVKAAVINLIGRTFMESLDCPFRKADELLAALPGEVKVRLVDFHAEATSEKIAMARYLDGRVSAVIGTHTHVQTNDARVLSGGTGAVTDAGMCGVEDSILGMDHRIILERFLTGLPKRFALAKGEARLNGVLFEADEENGRCLGVELI